ncbi:hypothetical protein C7417_3953 [Cupriavidus plantarum]|nr:hypothetical protein C7417_3953 [Cupriavidus plantarum]
MKRRRASFRQWIADYEARRGERDATEYEVWYRAGMPQRVASPCGQTFRSMTRKTKTDA